MSLCLIPVFNIFKLLSPPGTSIAASNITACVVVSSPACTLWLPLGALLSLRVPYTQHGALDVTGAICVHIYFQ